MIVIVMPLADIVAAADIYRFFEGLAQEREVAEARVIIAGGE